MTSYDRNDRGHRQFTWGHAPRNGLSPSGQAQQGPDPQAGGGQDATGPEAKPLLSPWSQKGAGSGWGRTDMQRTDTERSLRVRSDIDPAMRLVEAGKKADLLTSTMLVFVKARSTCSFFREKLQEELSAAMQTIRFQMDLAVAEVNMTRVADHERRIAKMTRDMNVIANLIVQGMTADMMLLVEASFMWAAAETERYDARLRAGEISRAGHACLLEALEAMLSKRNLAASEYLDAAIAAQMRKMQGALAGRGIERSQGDDR